MKGTFSLAIAMKVVGGTVTSENGNAFGVVTAVQDDGTFLVSQKLELEDSEFLELDFANTLQNEVVCQEDPDCSNDQTENNKLEISMESEVIEKASEEMPIESICENFNTYFGNNK